jgi:16S rRNA (adenine1518-N6/adenine1519-N6)-dimethyltransferase
MIRAKKSLGQNFLMHARIAERIADAADIMRSDTVFEIGPGTGMLTKPLLARAKKVVAIEADAELAAGLREKFSEEIGEGRLELIEGDIRAFDPSSLPAEYLLAANIPYYLTGEIIRTFLSAPHAPKSMTLLVQKEVAERIARERKGSLLSIAVRTFGEPSYLFTVPRGAFKPAPNVDSAVLRISGIKHPFKNASEETRFFDILRAGFAHKRKLLARNLEATASKEAIAAGFKAANLPERARAEDLSLADWQNLFRALI